jgi:hypothetical protein
MVLLLGQGRGYSQYLQNTTPESLDAVVAAVGPCSYSGGISENIVLKVVPAR